MNCVLQSRMASRKRTRNGDADVEIPAKQPYPVSCNSYII